MQGNIYTHSRFDPEEFSNGGCKRTAQIHETLNTNKIPFQKADFEQYTSKTKNVFTYLNGLNYKKKIGTNLRNDYRIGQFAEAFDKFTTQKKTSLFIWESISEHYLILGKTLWSKKIPFIAVPHNIDSLVKGNRSFTSGLETPFWFNEELKYLAYANKVFTISREEQWLLSLYGIDADYLPYYPTDNVKAYLLDIRSERKNKEVGKTPRKILILGTFYNMPTLRGYIDLLPNLSKFKDVIINIAGFGSEQLKSLKSPNIKIWGSVNNEVLRQILIDNDIAIIHQEPTTGALTKIPELLLAGIPIIANNAASRSQFDVKGVEVYYNYNELLDLVYSASLTPPPIPDAPVNAIRRFTDYINTF
jgi:hypothetical protein